jgi:porphobilinogen synthase
MFVREGKGVAEPIVGMPEVFRLSPDLILKEVQEAHRCGIKAVALFPVVDPLLKDLHASQSLFENNLANRTIQLLKKTLPDMLVIVDIALDPYTSHGHDGLVDDSGYVVNDATARHLAQMAVLCAAAGADIVAPSDMMDGRIALIRDALDTNGFHHTAILSYAAKYASAFYAPFREALQSAPAFGDKRSYQMDPANVREAIVECALDEKEGADMLLIKPALPYLDVISKVRAASHLPIGGYHVSGEYSMVKAAAANGWIDGDKVMEECLLSIKRAGADFILTYAALQVAKRLQCGMMH